MCECGDLSVHIAAVRVSCHLASSARISAEEHATLSAEITALAACINCAQQGLSAFADGNLFSREIPDATDNLNAIAAHTDAATMTILEQCEQLEQGLFGTPSQALVSAAASRIYEACSFQDITGQRIARIVRTLKSVELRVAEMRHIFGHSPMSLPVPNSAPLMSGPQPAHAAMDQTAVDALLASLE